MREWLPNITKDAAGKLFMSQNVPSSLIFNAFAGRLAVPDFEGFCEIVKTVYEKVLAMPNDGHNADYIPCLDEPPAGPVDPNQFGISVCTVDGQRFNIGDTDKLFGVQSTSKP